MEIIHLIIVINSVAFVLNVLIGILAFVQIYKSKKLLKEMQAYMNERYKIKS